jgi:hypothetical protein
VPHSDGNQRTFITVPVEHPSLPSGSYFAPSTLPSTVQRALLGRLERRKAPVPGLTWVQPRPLAGFLAALGHGGVSNILKGAHTDTMVPLLTRQALRELGREDLWPADWPPPPPAPLPPLPPGIQNVQMAAQLQLPAQMWRRGPGLRPGDAPRGGSSTVTCTRWLLAAATTLEAGQRGETLCP